MTVLAILTLITDTLTGINVAVPILFATIKTIRDGIGPEVTDAQLIDLMDAAFQQNHARNVALVAELRGEA
jgi:hypothetical protein